MKIKELAQACGLTVCVGGEDLTGEITGCYIGDLLSWAMGKVCAGDVWLTVMGNVNAVAVAVLADAACIVLVDNAVLDDIAKAKAAEQGVIVLQTEQSAFTLSKTISEMLG